MFVLSPLLGNAANDYLWAHGYLPKSVELIQRIYQESQDAEEFVQSFAAAGMAAAEAQYLYNLITR